jgi:hypothetical protein
MRFAFLRFQLWLRRRSLVVLINWAMLGITILVLFVAVPYEHRELKNEKIRSGDKRGRPEGAAQVTNLPSNNYSIFVSALGSGSSVPEYVHEIFQFAESAGLNLNEGRYVQNDGPAGTFSTYSIELPVAGPYPAIRNFVEKVLRSYPFASLDDLQFKRVSANGLNVEAQIHFTLALHTSLMGDQTHSTVIEASVP